MRLADWARLLLLAAIWGSSFIFMRVLAPVLGPVVTADARLLIAGLVLCAWFAASGFNVGWRLGWRKFLVLGAINSALPFVLFAYAAAHIPASYSAILNSTAPLFGAVFGALWLGEVLSARRVAGLGLGMGGVVLVSQAGTFAADAEALYAAFACLGATACYGLGGVYIKKFCAGLKPAAMAGASQLMAGLVLLPLIPLAPPTTAAIDGVIVANVLALALLCSGFAYLLYYRLMADVGPTRALTVTFLIPVFGLLWSALFLGERMGAGVFAGCALILAGTWLVTRAAPILRTPVITPTASPVSEGKSL